jgi:Ca-activated chloride channel family protein
MSLRTVRDVLVLAVLALLPWAAGCAANVRGSPRPAGADAASPSSSGMAQGMDPALRESGRGGFGSGGFATFGGPVAPLVPPQSLPAPDEELWVIARRGEDAAASRGDARDDTPGSGSLCFPQGDRIVPVPLKHTSVRASIAGYVGTVNVTQQFQNPFDGKIEAVYVFPLPHNAAVNEFVMTVGDRHIRGIVREREEAKQIYEEAKGQGYVASLLEQDRPNVFTQRVANIEPGKRIDIQIRYFHTLSYSDGWYEWVFPMVVGPRFNPPGTTDGVGAVGRGTPGGSGQKAEVQYLRPGERSGHDVDVAVNLDALVPVEAVESRTHKVTVAKKSERAFEVTLDEGDRIPNRDFVLRWKVAGEGVRSGLVVRKDKDGKGGYFAMMVVPPADLRKLPRSPVEMVFVLDVSGSMGGRPLEQAKGAVRWALAHLQADDTVQVVRFADGASVMAERPLPATPQNVRRAMKYIEGTSAGGGTMMLEGLRKALAPPADESRPRYVVFLTDGFIGNETEILGALQRMLGGSRVFSIGVGSSVNRYLLEHMAKLGRGAVAWLGLRDNAEDVMGAYFGAVSHPAMTELAVAWGAGTKVELYPGRLPDLFVGRPVTVVGRFEGEAPRAVKVSGRVRGETQGVEAVAEEAGAAEAALGPVWARMKIADLGDRLALNPRDGEVPVAVRQVALEHGLMSAYTAFVAVDAMTRTAGDHGTSVATPVPVPEGTRYETTVGE